MKNFHLAAAAFILGSSASLLCGQSAVAAKKPAATPSSPVPLIVDVHPSPYRPSTYYGTNISDRRFDMHDATLLDMIALAWDRRPETVLGGPAWIDFYRFDLSAKIESLRAPSSKPVSKSMTDPFAANGEAEESDPNTAIRPVLKEVLAKRFGFTFHDSNKLLSGYVVTQAKGGAKLAEAKDPTAAMDCRGEQAKDTPGVYTSTCTSVTMERFVAMFVPRPGVDRTGLKKSYDFKITLNMSNVRSQDDYVRAITDVFARQLGLVLTEQKISQPAMVIDKAERTPTPNEPDVAKLIPPLPELEFEVASIKPAAPDDPQWSTEPRGSQIAFRGWTLQDLLVHAWELPTGRMIKNVEALPKQKYSILVKLPPDIDARAAWQDQDEVFRMLQKLVVERFEVKYHWGEQMQDGWALLADSSRMKKSDPDTRTSCKEGPAEGEKEMRGAESPFDIEFHCQNVTMAQFADVLQSFARAEIKSHVVDKTRLQGAYDFTIYFSSVSKLQAESAAAVAGAQEAGGPSTPPAGISLDDAMRKELGLKLEKQPTSERVMVLDHFDQTPTEN